MSGKTVTYLIVSFVVFSFLFHYPFIAVTNEAKYIFGMPVFIIYLAVIWVGLIVTNYLIVRRKSKDEHGD
ncbi:hypothetical protein FNH22_24855 [Fulvivirga sp. M361]|uniref:hypothetical protein n=1 Tax=Fulvivirga sp. M361 TaxID=2594266 RepID=UPI00117B197F|nr:hypothetical protein [Fulvivirga sp. M361]TRX50885.1 hypothetical protein FNH22_24855 [Fulvivirga sp. M361]